MWWHTRRKQYFVFRRNGRVHLNRRGRQFSRLLAAELCASAVVMLDTPCSEVVWRVLATHCIRQFPLHLPSLASPCAITFQLDSTDRIDISKAKFLELCSFIRHDSRRILLPSSISRVVQDCLSHPSSLEKSARTSDFAAVFLIPLLRPCHANSGCCPNRHDSSRQVAWHTNQSVGEGGRRKRGDNGQLPGVMKPSSCISILCVVQCGQWW